MTEVRTYITTTGRLVVPEYRRPGPNRVRVNWRTQTTGALVASVIMTDAEARAHANALAAMLTPAPTTVPPWPHSSAA